MILSDLWPTFQGQDNIQCQTTRLIVSRVYAFDVLCAQLTRDLFAIAKFLLKIHFP